MISRDVIWHHNNPPTSDPKKIMKVKVVAQPETFVASGFVYRAFRETGEPLYLGEPTLTVLQRRVKESYTHRDIMFEVEPFMVYAYAGVMYSAANHAYIRRLTRHEERYLINTGIPARLPNGHDTVRVSDIESIPQEP